MLPGIADQLITFLTRDDKRLFESAVNIAHEHKLDMLTAFRIAYGVAADLLPGGEEISGDDFSMIVYKGVVSPCVAIMDAMRTHFGPATLVAKHVWLRTTVGNWSGEYSSVITSGNPNGKGGSYRATIVASAIDARAYDVSAAPEPIACRATQAWCIAWSAFQLEVHTC